MINILKNIFLIENWHQMKQYVEECKKEMISADFVIVFPL